MPFVQALMLYAAFAIGYPWYSSWLWPRLPEGNLSWLIVEVSALGLVCVLVAIVSGFRRVAVSWTYARAVPPQALFFLGVAALALRLIDPGFDTQEVGQAGLEASGVLAGYLLTLPFAVASEELIFRTCQSRLRRLLPPAPAIVAVGLAFAIYHWVPGTPLDRHAIESEIALVAGGMVLAAAYERAGSLRMMIATHLIYDGLAIAQGLLNVRHLRLAEAALFLLWLAVSGLLGWRWRRPRAALAPDGPPQPGGHPAAAWIAAAIFGCGFPLLLVWIRLRLG